MFCPRFYVTLQPQKKISMIIKVCGMREPQNIRDVAEAGADWIGFIFCTDSPRYVEQISFGAGFMPDFAPWKIVEASKDRKKVGVFVDDMPQSIITRIVNFRLDIVQLHGSESPVMIDNLRNSVVPDLASSIQIVKAINIGCIDDLKNAKQYEGHADYLLFDTKTDVPGGSGRKFDWNILNHYDGNLPFLIGGGIGPDDAEAITTIRHPRFMGVDINSAFETEPGLKDINKVKHFIEVLRHGQQ